MVRFNSRNGSSSVDVNIMEPASPLTPIDPRVEMFQKGQPTDAFFNMKALAPRPLSEATEIFDTEFEDDESDMEDNSPRLSLNSVSLCPYPNSTVANMVL